MHRRRTVRDEMQLKVTMEQPIPGAFRNPGHRHRREGGHTLGDDHAAGSSGAGPRRSVDTKIESVQVERMDVVRRVDDSPMRRIANGCRDPLGVRPRATVDREREKTGCPAGVRGDRVWRHRHDEDSIVRRSHRACAVNDECADKKPAHSCLHAERRTGRAAIEVVAWSRRAHAKLACLARRNHYRVAGLHRCGAVDGRREVHGERIALERIVNARPNLGSSRNANQRSWDGRLLAPLGECFDRHAGKRIAVRMPRRYLRIERHGKHAVAQHACRRAIRVWARHGQGTSL